MNIPNTDPISATPANLSYLIYVHASDPVFNHNKSGPWSSLCPPLPYRSGKEAPSGPGRQPQPPQARTPPGVSPRLPALLQIWVCGCYRKATFLTCGLRFLYQWSCFHFVTLPMTLAALADKPTPTMAKHFLLVKLLASPTLITVFPLLYFLMVTS